YSSRSDRGIARPASQGQTGPGTGGSPKARSAGPGPPDRTEPSHPGVRGRDATAASYPSGRTPWGGSHVPSVARPRRSAGSARFGSLEIFQPFHRASLGSRRWHRSGAGALLDGDPLIGVGEDARTGEVRGTKLRDAEA